MADIGSLTVKSIFEGVASEIGSSSVAWVVAQVFDWIFGSDSLEEEILEKLNEVLATEHEILTQLKDLVTQDIWDTLQAEVFPFQLAIINFFQEYQTLAKLRKTAKGDDLTKLRSDALKLREAILSPDNNGVNAALVALNQVIADLNSLDSDGGLLQIYITREARKLAEDPTSGSLMLLGQNAIAYLTAVLNLQWMGVAMLVSAHLNNKDKKSAEAAQKMVLGNFDAQLLLFSQTIPPLAHATAMGMVVSCRIQVPNLYGEYPGLWGAGGLGTPTAVLLPPNELHGAALVTMYINQPATPTGGTKIEFSLDNPSNPAFFEDPDRVSWLVKQVNSDGSWPTEAEGLPFYITPISSASGWLYRFNDGAGNVLQGNPNSYTNWIKAPPLDTPQDPSHPFEYQVFNYQSFVTTHDWAFVNPVAGAHLGTQFAASGTAGTIQDPYMTAWLMIQSAPQNWGPATYWPIAELKSDASGKWSVSGTLPPVPANGENHVCLVLLDTVSHARVAHQFATNPTVGMLANPGGLVVSYQSVTLG